MKKRQNSLRSRSNTPNFNKTLVSALKPLRLRYCGSASCSAGSPDRIESPLVVFARTVNGAHDRLIALDQYCRIHARLEVKSADRIVSRSSSPNSRPSRSSRLQSCVSGRALSSPTIASGIALLRIKSICRSKMSAGSLSKPDNEPGHHFHSVTLNLLHRVEQVAAVL